MIRRNASKYTQNQESLRQSSTTALKGVDCTKAPTSYDSVLEMNNLDVDYDGGLVLRKPLICSKFLNDYYKTFRMYNGMYLHVVKTERGYLLKTDPEVRIDFICTDVFGNEVEYKNFSSEEYLDLKDVVFFNTSSSTILCNLSINFKKYSPDRYTWEYPGTTADANLETAKRYLKVEYDEESEAVRVQVQRPDMNTLRLNELGYVFNQNLDNVFDIRDNYTTSNISIQGILAYRLNKVLESGWYTCNIPATPSEDYVFIDDPNSTQGLYYMLQTSDNPDKAFVVVKAYTKCVVKITTRNHLYIIELDTDETFTTLTDDMIDSDDASAPMHCTITFMSGSRVLDVTENESSKIVETFNSATLDKICLKAFVNFVPNNVKYYCVWEKTYNGVDWETVTPQGVSQLIDVAEPIKTSEDLKNDTVLYRVFKAQVFGSGTPTDYTVPLSPTNYIASRPDVLWLNKMDIATYRFRIFGISDIEEVSDEDGVSKSANIINVVYASKEYSPIVERTEYLSDSAAFPNTTLGSKLYYKRRIFTYGSIFKNNIHFTDFDDFTNPTLNVIDLDTFSDNSVTGMTPWRDYLIAYTNKTIHLITPQDAGFLTKTISTSIGIPEKDAKTCASILNGIIFKSDDKIYTVYPNFSSGSETILNISEISKPVENVLKNLEYSTVYNPFAFTDSEAYYLFIPQTTKTKCLKYDFSHKIWTVYTYNVLMYDYTIIDVSDIRIYAQYGSVKYEYYFNKSYSDVGITDAYEYGDILTTEQLSNYSFTPIEFFVDSGQKTDNISLTKQFVESKIIVATMDAKDSFNLNVRVDIDGNTFDRHIDLNTDGALIRTDSEQVLTLGTSSDYVETYNTFNTMRQMFLRYSGKGKTVRHILSGESLYKFKIYEIFYRYKLLNVKQ